MWRIADRGGIEQSDSGFLHRRTHPPDAKQNYKVSNSKAESGRSTFETTGIGEGSEAHKRMFTNEAVKPLLTVNLRQMKTVWWRLAQTSPRHADPSSHWPRLASGH